MDDEVDDSDAGKMLGFVLRIAVIAVIFLLAGLLYAFFYVNEQNVRDQQQSLMQEAVEVPTTTQDLNIPCPASNPLCKD